MPVLEEKQQVWTKSSGNPKVKKRQKKNETKKRHDTAYLEQNSYLLVISFLSLRRVKYRTVTLKCLLKILLSILDQVLNYILKSFKGLFFLGGGGRGN